MISALWFLAGLVVGVLVYYGCMKTGVVPKPKGGGGPGEPDDPGP